MFTFIQKFSVMYFNFSGNQMITQNINLIYLLMGWPWRVLFVCIYDMKVVLLKSNG